MEKFNYYPLIGILVSKGKTDVTFRGDSTVLRSIQKELLSIGGLSFIFSTDDIKDNCVSGFIYYETQEKWGKVDFPFPDLIYNKISTRKEEVLEPFLALKKVYKNSGKYFFNPCFFNKWETYSSLTRSEKLAPYLPETWMYSTMSDLLSKLTTHHSVYVKPVNGHKGKGIYKLSFDGVHYFVQRKDKKVKYFYSDFVQYIGKLLKKSPYLLQKEIVTDTIDGDCKYDLRILCMYKEDSHKILGIGVRKALPNSIITHVPNGGDIIPLDRIKHKYSKTQLNQLVEEVGQELSKTLGFIGEFSIDVGIATDGKPVIFEVNSKPMVFDEEDIQANRIVELARLFKELAPRVG